MESRGIYAVKITTADYYLVTTTDKMTLNTETIKILKSLGKLELMVLQNLGRQTKNGGRLVSISEASAIFGKNITIIKARESLIKLVEKDLVSFEKRFIDSEKILAKCAILTLKGLSVLDYLAQVEKETAVRCGVITEICI
jgi:hypothetical protein